MHSTKAWGMHMFLHLIKIFCYKVYQLILMSLKISQNHLLNKLSCLYLTRWSLKSELILIWSWWDSELEHNSVLTKHHVLIIIYEVHTTLWELCIAITMTWDFAMITIGRVNDKTPLVDLYMPRGEYRSYPFRDWLIGCVNINNTEESKCRQRL